MKPEAGGVSPAEVVEYINQSTPLSLTADQVRSALKVLARRGQLGRAQRGRYLPPPVAINGHKPPLETKRERNLKGSVSTQAMLSIHSLPAVVGVPH
jgi:predicted transcriptional regulator of viral defense system